MLSRTKKLLGTLAVVGFCLVVACSARVGGGGAFVEIGILGLTFRIPLSQTFNVQANAAPIQQAVQVQNLFPPPVGNRPANGRVSINKAVRVTPLGVVKAVAPLQPITGNFEVVTYIGPVSSTDPCADGTLVGTFHVTVSAGTVTVQEVSLDVPMSALLHLITGSFTLCFEVSGDVDATVTIDDMDATFSEEAVPDDNVNDNGAAGTTTASFTFRNDDVENIHFLLPGQDFPANRVGPGGTETDSLSNVAIGDSITVQAGRNGVVLTSTSCPTVTGANYSATVVWNGTTLTCESTPGAQTGDGMNGSDGTGGATSATDLAGCWRVTLNQQEGEEVTPLVLIYEIDSAGNLATLWVEAESEGVTNTVEMARFTTANAGMFATIIQNPQQDVSVDAAGTADLSLSFDVQVEEGGETTSLTIDIEDAVLSGDPPSSFTSNSVSGESGDITFGPPANGQKTECPNVSDEVVISQEEFELEFEDLDLCGEGTAMMMPLMLLGLCWMKLRK